MDNGPEFIANVLQEWCTASGCSTASIPPGSPWENPFVESFNSRFRDEFLNIELFTSVQETKLLAEQHRLEYNTYRPHSALRVRWVAFIGQFWPLSSLTPSGRNGVRFQCRPHGEFCLPESCVVLHDSTSTGSGPG